MSFSDRNSTSRRRVQVRLCANVGGIVAFFLLRLCDTPHHAANPRMTISDWHFDTAHIRTLRGPQVDFAYVYAYG